MNIALSREYQCQKPAAIATVLEQAELPVPATSACRGFEAPTSRCCTDRERHSPLKTAAASAAAVLAETPEWRASNREVSCAPILSVGSLPSVGCLGQRP